MNKQPLDGRALLHALKLTARPRGETALSLTVGCPVEAVLRPVATRGDQLDPNDVHLLTEWRNRFVQSFLTEFTADDERTARWLTDVVGPDDTRILFMLDGARDGQTIGYMGLAFIDWEQGAAEADAIVRGGEAPRGLMKRGLLTLLRWAQQQLGLRTLGVRVRSDNPAVEFYRRMGFAAVRRVPLRRIEQPEMLQWTEDESLPPGEPSLVHMRLPAAILEGQF